MTGTIVDDETGGPLSGVMVACAKELDESVEAVSDSQGNFFLTTQKYGVHTMHFFLDGYEDAPADVTTSCQATDVGIVRLRKKAIESDDPSVIPNLDDPNGLRSLNEFLSIFTRANCGLDFDDRSHRLFDRETSNGQTWADLALVSYA